MPFRRQKAVGSMARVLGISRNTVKKYLAVDSPLAYPWGGEMLSATDTDRIANQ
ncbi:MAG: hypothetical protein J7K94_05435 [Dehalococcoidia bacterium]|nr:hypothetical protein [Dehalococcoidia bacterium]